MLDTSLDWKIAKEQCGDGTEDIAVIEPDDDAVLYTGLWNAYRTYFPNMHLDAGALIPFIEGKSLDRNMRDRQSQFDAVCKNSRSDSSNLSFGLQDRTLVHINQASMMNDELIWNVLDVSVKHHIPVSVRSYIGENGGAFATEQNGFPIDTKKVLSMERCGNRGKGWPQFLSAKKDRVGIERDGELFRAMLIQTCADRADLFLPHAANRGSLEKPKYVVNGVSVWNSYVETIIEQLRAKHFWHMEHPPHKRLREPTTRDLNKDALIEEYRELAWKRVREFYPLES